MTEDVDISVKQNDFLKSVFTRQIGREAWIRNMILSGMLGGWEDNSFHTALKFQVVMKIEEVVKITERF